MFVTHPHYRVALPGARTDGGTTWRRIDVQLRAIAFFVRSLRIGAPPSEEKQTFIATLAEALETADRENAQILQIELLVPPGVSGSPDWKMEPLVCAWECTHACDPHVTVELYQGKSGAEYSDEFAPQETANLHKVAVIFDGADKVGPATRSKRAVSL